ncbi:MAG: LptA/OstA family protein, partial [Pseudomonadota bacterium]
MRALITLIAATLLLAGAARAQEVPEFDPEEQVALIADEVIYNSETGEVTASGNVEVYYGERTLTADRIVYDDRTGRISAAGEIVLRDPTGTTVFADVVDLDADLRDGLI